MEQGLIYTNSNCISCNKCVKVCTSPGASYLQMDGNDLSVNIDPGRCISCGACIALCEHEAREYRDDTDRFFRDLEKGEPISVLLAPAFLATYPEEYASILGGLKALGVRRFISVAFGADLCTWAYIRYMQEKDFRGGISTTCPVTVEYIERCLPELIPRLVPVLSPMACAATYCREEMGITDRLAFISPCIGKKLEMTEDEKSPVQYNVTFQKLMAYVREHQIYGEAISDEIEYGLGSFYPAPGGLAENLRWFLGDEVPIRVVSGKTYLYGWMNTNARWLAGAENPFLLIDALNCQEGCIEGTASEIRRFEEDQVFYSIQKIRNSSKKQRADSPWNASMTPSQRLERLNRQFAGLSLSHYLRKFSDKSAGCRIRIPDEKEADRIFNQMHKTTPESRRINCSTCGYGSCHDLMVAIYNNFNNRRSCIYYEAAEAIRLERLSFCDQLTSVMNRNALQQFRKGMMYPNKSTTVIEADVNGLKEKNDVYGHEAGDKLIITVATTLAGIFGRENVYRIGGDEFLILLQDYTEEECREKIGRVRLQLEQNEASASIGYAYSEGKDSDLETLIALADKAMYRDKEEYYRRTGKKRR